MADLHADVLRHYFGADGPLLHLGLLNEGREVSDPGYARAAVRGGQWRLDGTSAHAVVEFGPFAATVRFDGVALYRGQQPLDSVELEDFMQVLAGTVHAQSYTVRLVRHG